MDDIRHVIDRLAEETGFAGVVRVDVGDDVVFEQAYGEADRAHGIANLVGTRFGVASVAKGFTALVVAGLVEDSILGFETTARPLLGSDLPLIDDTVTVGQLLAHRSGIGDYLDEDAGGDILDYPMPVPVHELDDTERYLRVLDSFPTKFPPGTDFAYCNGGYVVLALLAERAANTSYYDLVRQRVCEPAGLQATAFTRTDELDGECAIGYLAADGLRTNALHLPVRGCGDGGIYSTVGDLHALWAAVFDGRILPPSMIAEMTRRHPSASAADDGYGLGFWLPHDEVVMLQGYDAGVSANTVHDPTGRITHSVVSNTTEGAWPITRRLRDLLGA